MPQTGITLREFADANKLVDGMVMPPEPIEPCGCLRCTIYLATFINDMGAVFGPFPNLN